MVVSKHVLLVYLYGNYVTHGRRQGYKDPYCTPGRIIGAKFLSG